jgi:hypothetical protein
LDEIDDMLRRSNHLVENLSRIREVVMAQQNALSEKHARAGRGSHFDNGFVLHDANGDAKKPCGVSYTPHYRCPFN